MLDLWYNVYVDINQQPERGNHMEIPEMYVISEERKINKKPFTDRVAAIQGFNHMKEFPGVYPGIESAILVKQKDLEAYYAVRV